MSSPQLKLVTPLDIQPQTSSDPIRRLFDHWVFMAQKNPARAKLGPQRRQAIAAALTLYTEDELQLAIDGNLIDAWCVANGRHDLDWLLVGESRVERFIELGEHLRERLRESEAAARRQQADSAAPNDGPHVDAAEAAAIRQRLRLMVQEFQRSGGRR
jgi:hypothetical protein